jgi:hypothetical protein
LNTSLKKYIYTGGGGREGVPPVYPLLGFLLRLGFILAWAKLTKIEMVTKGGTAASSQN